MMDNHVRLKTEAFSALLELNVLAMKAQANKVVSRSIGDKYFDALLKLGRVISEALEITTKANALEYSPFNNFEILSFTSQTNEREVQVNFTGKLNSAVQGKDNIELTDAINTIHFIEKEALKIVLVLNFGLFVSEKTISISFKVNDFEYLFMSNDKTNST